MRARHRRHAYSTFIVDPPGLLMFGRLRRGWGTSTLRYMELGLLGPALAFAGAGRKWTAGMIGGDATRAAMLAK